jgi:hypothetical protein
MPVLTLTVKHGRTQEAARAELEQAVQQVQAQYATMVHRVVWSDDRNTVTIWGTGGIEVELRVDPQDLHVKGDVPNLLGLLGSPLLLGLQGAVRQHFPALPR